MKKYIPFVLSILFIFKVKAQNYPVIETSLSKVSHLIFPEPIKEVSIGEPGEFSLDFSDELLKIYPLSEKYIHTNLLVKTKENYYSFFVKNLKEATQLTYFIKSPLENSNQENTKEGNILSSRDSVELALRKKTHPIPIKTQSCKLAKEKTNEPEKKEIKGLFDLFSKKALSISTKKIKLSLLGIFTHGPHTYLKLKLENNSLLNFHIQSISLYTKAKKRKNKSSIKLREIPILWICSQLKTLPYSSMREEVLVIKNITLSNQEDLFIEIFEKPQGERHLRLKLSDSALEEIKLLVEN